MFNDNRIVNPKIKDNKLELPGAKYSTEVVNIK
jgi:hypothetical protein